MSDVAQAVLPGFVLDTMHRIEEMMDPERSLMIRDLAHLSEGLGTLLAFLRYLDRGPEAWRADPQIRDFANQVRALQKRVATRLSQVRDSQRGAYHTISAVPVELHDLESLTPRFECVPIEGAKRWSSLEPETDCDGAAVIREVSSIPGARFMLHVRVPRTGL